MKAYFIRVEIPSTLPNGVLVITETAGQPPRPNVASVILDIDAVVHDVKISIDTAWQIIEDLRQEKNNAFEACITDETRKLFA